MKAFEFELSDKSISEFCTLNVLDGKMILPPLVSNQSDYLETGLVREDGSFGYLTELGRQFYYEMLSQDKMKKP